MDSILMFGGWIIIGANLLSIFLYIELIWGSSLDTVVGYLLLSLAGSLLTALYAGFVPWPTGACLVCFSPLTILLSVVMLIINRRKLIQELGHSHLSHKVYTICALCVMILQLSPIVGFSSVSEVCSGIARSRINSIVIVLEKYHSDYGEYPEELDVLIPDYMDALPRSICGENFFLVQCSPEKVALAIYTPNKLSINLYDLENENWSSFDSLDFNFCNRLD